MGLDPYELHLSLQAGDAVARWLKNEHPEHTAKNVARKAGLDPRTVENILDRHLSGPTLTKLLLAYGWRFGSQVLTAVLGETYEQSIERELQEIADARAQLDDAERRARDSWARARARGSVDRGGLRLVAESDGDTGGEVGGERRSLGAQPPR